MATSSVNNNAAAQSVYDQLNGTKSTTSDTSSTSSSSDRIKMDFLSLLTAQLKNQDPLNPLDNAQTTSQLAQISTVDGIEKLNTQLSTMFSSFQANETYQAAALIGHQVLVEGNQLKLTEGVAVGGIEMPAAADKAFVTVYNKDGTKVAELSLGKLDAGANEFVWDGKTADGTQLEDGTYTIKVSASNEDGTKVTPKSLELASVFSVGKKTDGSIELEVGRFGQLSMSDIKRIL
uniref:Basal-body rod modification protein FlgD n=1 Tax=Sphingomonas sp. A1 TaxID=90322 RepID=A0A0A8K7K6_9SPHN|nr:flagellar basal body rod modification protein FlgD [Sphingomonas sp. A1]